MRVWSKIKYPFYFLLFLLGAVALRIALPALPYDWPLVTSIQVIVILFSRELNGTDWVLWDILVAIIAFCVIFFVPVQGKYSRVRRFLLRPMVLVLVAFLAAPFVNSTVEHAQKAYEDYQDRQYQAKVDANLREIQDFIEIADEAYIYSTTKHTGDHDVAALQGIAINGKYVTDTMMIDYDTMTLGFCFDYITMFQLRTFSLEPGGKVPESCEWSHTLDLVDSGGRLTMYFEYLGGSPNIMCIALTMPDGKVYTAADLTDPKTGHSEYIGHIDGGYFVRIDDFLERK